MRIRKCRLLQNPKIAKHRKKYSIGSEHLTVKVVFIGCNIGANYRIPYNIESVPLCRERIDNQLVQDTQVLCYKYLVLFHDYRGKFYYYFVNLTPVLIPLLGVYIAWYGCLSQHPQARHTVSKNSFVPRTQLRII